VASGTRRGRSSTITVNSYYSFPFFCSLASDDFLSASGGGGAGEGVRRFSPPSVPRLLYKGASSLVIAIELAHRYEILSI